MPADGISLPPKNWGLRHVPLGRLVLGYITTRLGGRGGMTTYGTELPCRRADQCPKVV